MSVILKHEIAFPEAGIVVGSDIFGPTLLLNAEVKLEILRGAVGSAFEIAFDAMPLKSAKTLADASAEGTLTAVIKLGYFDAGFKGLTTVMEGVVSKVEGKTEAGKLKTKVTGLEKTTHALRAIKAEAVGSSLHAEEDVALGVLLSDLLAAEGLNGAAGRAAAFFPPNLGVSMKVTAPVARGETLLDVIDDVVSRAVPALPLGGGGRPQVFVYDGKVTVGLPLQDATTVPWMLDPGLNLAEFAPFQRSVDPPEGANRLERIALEKITGFNFTVAGEPAMRPAQMVVPLIKDYLSAKLYRIHSVRHEYGKDGYRCRGRAIEGTFDQEPRDTNAASATPSSRAFLAGLTERVSAKVAGNVVETGLVKRATPDETGRLDAFYHQRFGRETRQPSIAADVDRDPRKILANLPVASPFAWHKTGLVTPVYPGMKTILVHNLGLEGDAVVAGSVWSEMPAIEPPPAEAGDWWLSLPLDASGTGPDGSGPPPPTTKAANDLTTKSGARVIETPSLRIRVGSGLLGTIGTRPSPGSTDECVIEHASGTVITIDSAGKVTIDASEVEVTGNLTVGGNAKVSGMLEVG